MKRDSNTPIWQVFYLFGPWHTVAVWNRCVRVLLGISALAGQLWLLTKMGIGWQIAEVVVVAVWLATIGQVVYYRYRKPTKGLYSTPYIRKYMREARKNPASVPPIKWEYVPLDQISPTLITMVDIIESVGYFTSHRGFLGEILFGAYISNRKGKALIGGSNISQQTAKNFFLPFTRRMWRKIIESHYTIWIEIIWGKRLIMEYYLNVVEFGMGIFGCQAACQHYFGHGVSHVTDEEASLLVGTLPSPRRNNPGTMTPFLIDHANNALRQYQCKSPTRFEHKRGRLDPQRIIRPPWSLVQFGMAVIGYETTILFNRIYGKEKRQ